MKDLIVGFFMMLDAARIRTKEVVFALAVHFLTLIGVEIWMQFGLQQLLHPAYAIFGIFWVLAGLYFLFSLGSKPLDFAVMLSVGSESKMPTDRFTRMLEAFFVIELFAVLFFLAVPLYANPPMFGLILVSTPLYFAVRKLAGKTIDWNNWVWVPQAALGVGVLLCWIIYIVSLLSKH